MKKNILVVILSVVCVVLCSCGANNNAVQNKVAKPANGTVDVAEIAKKRAEAESKAAALAALANVNQSSVLKKDDGQSINDTVTVVETDNTNSDTVSRYLQNITETNWQSEAAAEEATENVLSEEGIDLDLTTMSPTMVFAEVSNMMSNPTEYVDRIVKMSGSFNVYESDTTGKRYYSCIISDATSCCSNGLEFTWNGNHSYPEDYPEKGDSVTVVGRFEIYDEDGVPYVQLVSDSVRF